MVIASLTIVSAMMVGNVVLTKAWCRDGHLSGVGDVLVAVW